MTRARQRLFLTSALSRRLYNSDSYNQPSRFLDEVPERLVQRWNGFGSAGRQVPSAESGGWRAASHDARAEARDRTRTWRFGTSNLEPRTSDHTDGPAPPFVDHLQVGMRVRHPEWGIGTIKERIGEGEDLKVVVTFAGMGRKKLAASFVQLDRA
jgi:DNA helicase-2/ATP-dependent DNA helicase PcrA